MMRAGFSLQIAALVALGLVWQGSATIIDVSWYPSLTSVLERTAELFADGRLPEALRDSVPSLLIGYGISVVGGVTLGFLMGTFYPIRDAILPYISAALVSPAIALAPVFFAIFGLSPWSLIAVIVLFTLPFVVVNTLTGVEQVSSDLISMVRSYGASQVQVYKEVTVHAAAPLVLAGLRLGLTRAIKGMIAGQLILSVFGLGRLATEFAGTFDARGAMSVALVTIVLAVISVGGLQRLETWADSRTQ